MSTLVRSFPYSLSMQIFFLGILFLGSFRAVAQDLSSTNEPIFGGADILQQNKAAELLSDYVQRQMQKAETLFTAPPDKRDVAGAKVIWKEVGQLSADNLYQEGAMLVGQAALASGNFEAAKKALSKVSILLGPLTNQVLQISPATWSSEDWNSPEGNFLVRICDASLKSLGTGSIISPGGVILTAAHVVAEQPKLYAHLWDGRFLEVSGINGGDLKDDLAFLKVSASDLPFAKLAKNPASFEEPVTSVGFPLGSLWPVRTKGLFEKNIGSTSDLAFVTTPGFPGMSGGPVLNSKNEIIGIFSQITVGKSLKPQTTISTLKPSRDKLGAGVSSLTFVTPAEALEWKQKSSLWSMEKIDEGVTTAKAAALLKTEPVKAIALLENLANQGNTSAQEVLSDAYLEGILIPRDIQKGCEWLEKAAAGGSPNSQTRLGLFMLRGNEQDRKEAVGWFRKAADQNFPGGLMMLGYATYGGYCGLEKNPKLGKDYLQKAADMGDRFAIAALATIRIKESGWNDETKKYVFKLANDLASNGDPLGNETLAGFYASGTIVEKDLNKAADLYKAAAISGSPAAAYKYATTLLTRFTQEGKIPDAETLQDCERWCVRSGELGDSNGYALAFSVYFDRKKLLKEPAADEVSIRYIEKACEMGNAFALFQYGKLLATGESGFKKDQKRALELLEEAGKKGVPGAGAWIGMVKLEMDREKK